MLIMNRLSANIAPLCISYCLVIILLFQSTRPAQSIALSNLCGQFGHSCFGGNWGKRELVTSSTIPNLIQPEEDTNDGGPMISIDEEKLTKDLLLEEMRLSLLRQRLRQLLKLD